MNTGPQDIMQEIGNVQNEQTLPVFSSLSLTEFRTVFNTIGPSQTDNLPELSLMESDLDQGFNRFSKDGSVINQGQSELRIGKRLDPQAGDQLDFSKGEEMELRQGKRLDMPKTNIDEEKCESRKLPGERITEWMRLKHYPKVPNICRSIDQNDTPRILKQLIEKLKGTRDVPNPQLHW